jgi:hypothetical protein
MSLSLDQVVTCSVVSSAILYILEQDVALSSAYNGATRVGQETQFTGEYLGGLAQKANYRSSGRAPSHPAARWCSRQGHLHR